MKCYIAAPFFNPEQIERVEFIKSVLKSKGIKFFSPKDECVVSDINSKKERQKCFRDNCDHIDTSDFVVAVTDSKDPGTIFEAGYAFCQSIPIVYFCETLGTGRFNLMLAESGTTICLTRDQFDQVDFENIFDLVNDYVGSIE